MNIVVVCAGIVRDGTRILIAQRKEEALEGLRWEFPGGKLAFGETPPETIVRELREELGLQVEVQQVFHVAAPVYGDRQFVILAYLCRALDPSFQLLDAADARWVSIDELGQFDMPVADIEIRDHLLRSLEH